MPQWSLMSGEEGAGKRYYRIRDNNDVVKKVDCENDERSDDDIRAFLCEQEEANQIKAFEFIYRHEGYGWGHLFEPKPSLSKNDALLLKSIFAKLNWNRLIELNEISVGPKTNPSGTQKDYEAFIAAVEKLDNHFDSIIIP